MNDLLRMIRPAVFVGSSRKDLRAFPAKVRQEIGQSLFTAQLGDHPGNANPLKVRQRLREAETIHRATGKGARS